MVLAASPTVLPLLHLVLSVPHTVLPHRKPQFHPIQHICHRLIFYMSVAPGFFKGTFTWVCYIFEGVFVIPPPKGYD